MLKKFVTIKNVGKFVNYAYRGDVEFRKLTLIYAENGSGKTTLSTILRSLKTGNSTILNAKQTLGGTGAVAVSVLLQSGMADFKDGAWTTTKPTMEVFDSAFINNNIYSGDHIDSDHRRNLCRFVIGEEGVRLVKEVEDLAQQYKDSGTSLSAAESKVVASQAAKMEVAAYIKLPQSLGIEDSITIKEKQIEALKKVNQIKSKPAPTKLNLPEVPLARLTELLSKRLDDVSSDAEAKTKAYVQQCLDHRGEAWLNQGVSYIHDDLCPFCLRALNGSEIVKHFQDFFSESYTALKKEIQTFGQEADTTFSNQKLVVLTKQLADNEASFDFWAEHIEQTRPTIQTETISLLWPSISKQIQAHVTRKLSAPLEPIELDGELLASCDAFCAIVSEMDTYNQLAEEVARKAAVMKLDLSAGNLGEALKELAFLKNIRARYLPDAVTACAKYQEIQDLRKRLNKAKSEVKERLDLFTDEVFGKYQERINRYLETFGARFSITPPSTSYAGGKPSSTYSLVINDCQVGIGDSGAQDRPCFGNTLSEGDKTTLAFAFFLARLDADDDLGSKVVVFDDPISSLDTHRKQRTQQLINQVLTRAKQVVVLSHDAFFLRLIWDNTNTVQCRSLTISRSGGGSTIGEWDVVQATLPQYFRNYHLLLNYLERGHEGELIEIAQSIRVYLEGNLRMRFPRQFGEDIWLGTFIEKVRNASEGDELAILRPHLTELSDVNDFSKRFHHDQTPSAPPSPPTDTELQTFVRMALKLGGGIIAAH